MPHFLIPTFVAAVVAFLLGGMWYGFLFPDLYLDELTAAGETPSPTGALQMLAEFARCFAVAWAFWRLIGSMRVTGLREASTLALVVWAGFQAPAIVGAVVHEGYPWKLFALHAADALLKTIVIASLLTMFAKSVAKGQTA